MSDITEPADEFDCAQCGRHIVSITPNTSGICALCTAIPGWYNNPDLAPRLGTQATEEFFAKMLIRHPPLNARKRPT